MVIIKKWRDRDMGEEQKAVLEKKLWAIANELRGQMGADEFRDYILGVYIL